MKLVGVKLAQSNIALLGETACSQPILGGFIDDARLYGRLTNSKDAMV